MYTCTRQVLTRKMSCRWQRHLSERMGLCRAAQPRHDHTYTGSSHRSLCISQDPYPPISPMSHTLWSQSSLHCGWHREASKKRGASLAGDLIAEFYLVDRGLRHRLPGFSSLDRPVVLTQGLRRFRCQWSHCGSCPTGPDSRGAGSVRSELIPIGHVAY